MKKFEKNSYYCYFTAVASKFCNGNGQWEATNYLDCIKSLVSHLYETDCYAKNKSVIDSNSTVSYVETIECEDVVSNDILLEIVADLYLVGFILTLFVVGTAIGIFSSIRYFYTSSFNLVLFWTLFLFFQDRWDALEIWFIQTCCLHFLLNQLLSFPFGSLLFVIMKR